MYLEEVARRTPGQITAACVPIEVTEV